MGSSLGLVCRMRFDLDHRRGNFSGLGQGTSIMANICSILYIRVGSQDPHELTLNSNL